MTNSIKTSLQHNPKWKKGSSRRKTELPAKDMNPAHCSQAWKRASRDDLRAGRVRAARLSGHRSRRRRLGVRSRCC